MPAHAQASLNGCFFPLSAEGASLQQVMSPASLEPGSLQSGQPTQWSPWGQGSWCPPHPSPNCSSQAALNCFGQTGEEMKDGLGSGVHLPVGEYPARPLQHRL